MTDAAFRELVAKMRDAQRAYFQMRGQDYLRTARDFERRVDAELDRKPGLFGNEPTS